MSRVRSLHLSLTVTICYNSVLRHKRILLMSEIPQTDVSRPSALPSAKLSQRGTAAQALLEQNSAEYLDSIEEEWNKRVDAEVETLVDGMVDLVSLASVNATARSWGNTAGTDAMQPDWRQG